MMQADINANEKKDTASCGKILKETRERVGLTQDQLSGLSTVSVRAIRDLELGKVQVPRRDTVRLLSDALGMGGSRRAFLESVIADARSEGNTQQTDDSSQAFPPISTGPLVGRQAELRAITELLGTERERLVSVVGCTGVGKTRLALEAAEMLNATSHVPVFWASIGGRADPTVAARELTLPTCVNEVPFSESVRDLIQAIGEGPALLVLDDLEASPSLQASLVQVLQARPGLNLLTTNREPIFGLGRRVLPLAPLALPESEDGISDVDAPALALMMSYLSHLRPDIQPTDSIVGTMAGVCHSLDGLPRALESAASWLSLYEPSQLADAAESSPLMLTESIWVEDAHADWEFRRSLEQSLSGLESKYAALLRVLTSTDTSCTVDAIAEQAQCTLREAMHGLHALLLRGFVRRTRGEHTDQDGLTDLTVLNLVRHLVSQEATAKTAPPSALLNNRVTIA
jgi:transcriptional regulator with XRE-family HTH domain